ncbi:hypothetical protein [Burkholderia ubonensis]|uniref:hypothetical protein n=1 Tax=Burkholderia ubonensis TaxID=101571 RepID=UPI001E37F337|nr:hypothetical protein [Burkholderia ubonensis]
MPLNNERISYYRVDKLLWRWKLRDGTDGCKIVPDIALSMDMAPPPLPKQPAPKTVPTKPAPKPPKPHAFDKMVDDIERVSNAISRFKTWLNTPDPPKVPKPAPIEKKKETVPPFDLQEIPSVMRTSIKMAATQQSHPSSSTLKIITHSPRRPPNHRSILDIGIVMV